MDFFKLQNSSNGSVIGVYPQADHKSDANYNPNSNNGIWNVKIDEFPDFVPRVGLQLNKKARLTNALSASTINFGYVLDKKVLDLLKATSLPKHHIYSIDVFDNELNRLNYYWIHFITEGFWSWVDKNLSKVFIRQFPPERRHEIIGEIDISLPLDTVNAKIDSLSFMERVYWEKLVLNDKFPKYDFFQISHIEHTTIISEKFKSLIEENNISGFDILPFKKMQIACLK